MGDGFQTRREKRAVVAAGAALCAAARREDPVRRVSTGNQRISAFLPLNPLLCAFHDKAAVKTGYRVWRRWAKSKSSLALAKSGWCGGWAQAGHQVKSNPIRASHTNRGARRRMSSAVAWPGPRQRPLPKHRAGIGGRAQYRPNGAGQGKGGRRHNINGPKEKGQFAGNPRLGQHRGH
jgi:hypothetical protein